jgi:hypothetical protein
LSGKGYGVGGYDEGSGPDIPLGPESSLADVSFLRNNFHFSHFDNGHKEGVVRTSIVMDDIVLEEAFSVSKARTKKDMVHEALRELIRIKRRKDMTELAGSIES